jgi:hypothetical protein
VFNLTPFTYEVFHQLNSKYNRVRAPPSFIFPRSEALQKEEEVVDVGEQADPDVDILSSS